MVESLFGACQFDWHEFYVHKCSLNKRERRSEIKSNRKQSQTAEKPAKYGQFNDCSWTIVSGFSKEEKWGVLIYDVWQFFKAWMS